MLGNRAHDTGDWCFLKGIRANGSPSYLTTNNNQGNRIGHGIPDGGDCVGCPRSGSHQHHPWFTGCSGVARGHKSSSLFIGWNNQRHWVFSVYLVFRVVSENRIVGWQNCPTTVSKNDIDSLFSKNTDTHCRTFYFCRFCHVICLHRFL